MKLNEIESLVSIMEDSCTEFKNTRVFTLKLVRDACDKMGVSHNTSITKFSDKVKYGLYKYNGIIGTKMAKPQVTSAAEVKLSVVTPITEQPALSSITESIKKTVGVVPVLDENFVPFGHYKEIEKIIKSEIFFPVFITGHSGNGKSSQVIHICAKNNRKLIRINMTKQTDQETLIGCKTLNNGNIEIEEGPVLSAMRTGSVLLLDECLSEHEKIRVGTVDNWKAVPLSDFEFNREYPVISFNMETGFFENDIGSIISDKEDELYEVELDDGSKIILNGRHPFIVNHEGKFVQKTIEDGLSVGDVVVKM